jgi:methylphosphotriester-DNA--protein-cysteine methyltransferase
MPFTADPHSHPSPPAGETIVVFDDHQFCAGRKLFVEPMTAPHRHSQFEVNFLLEGAMVYRFDGVAVRIAAGVPVLFWGMVPHQVVEREPGTRFVCLYVPAALMMALRLGESLREAMFRGSLIEAERALDTDAAAFRRWHADLMTGESSLAAIACDELSARLRRMEHDGWRDICHGRPGSEFPAGGRAHRSDKVETMMRFIDEHSSASLDVAAVARAADLHPNYAMSLFKKAVGLTIAQYLTRSRLDTAQALLVSTDRDIAAIAFAAGFGSLSRFYDAFRGRFGQSPGHFRRLARGAGD